MTFGERKGGWSWRAAEGGGGGGTPHGGLLRIWRGAGGIARVLVSRGLGNGTWLGGLGRGRGRRDVGCGMYMEFEDVCKSWTDDGALQGGSRSTS